MGLPNNPAARLNPDVGPAAGEAEADTPKGFENEFEPNVCPAGNGAAGKLNGPDDELESDAEAPVVRVPNNPAARLDPNVGPVAGEADTPKGFENELEPNICPAGSGAAAKLNGPNNELEPSVVAPAVEAADNPAVGFDPCAGPVVGEAPPKGPDAVGALNVGPARGAIAEPEGLEAEIDPPTGAGDDDELVIWTALPAAAPRSWTIIRDTHAEHTSYSHTAQRLNPSEKLMEIPQISQLAVAG
jgi:hypothetical protein